LDEVERDFMFFILLIFTTGCCYQVDYVQHWEILHLIYSSASWVKIRLHAQISQG